MSTRTDKLFKNKLAEHTMVPSPGAWAKVEAGLAKKNNGLIWFRWAAALLIPVLFAAWLMFFRTTENVNDNSFATTEKKTKQNQTKPAEKTEKQEAPLNSKVPALKKEKKSGATTDLPAPSRIKGIPSEAGTTMVLDEANEPTTEKELTTEKAAVAEQAATGKPLAEEIKTTESLVVPPQAIAVAAAEKPMVLEYTLQPVEKAVPIEKGITITMELKEKKGIQKVIDFAIGAKNSEGPFTALRQAKQELFALNFTKDKHPK